MGFGSGKFIVLRGSWSSFEVELWFGVWFNVREKPENSARKQTHNNKLISLYSWWYFGFSNLSWLRRSICGSGTQRFIAHTKPLTIRGLHHETRFKLWLQDPFKAHTKLLTIRRLHHGGRNAPCWLLLSNKSQLAPWIEWYSCHALFLTLVSLPPSNGWAKKHNFSWT